MKMFENKVEFESKWIITVSFISRTQVNGLPLAYTLPSNRVEVTILATISPEWQSIETL